MVMETPSAQCVGREFVRQYYTLLNEAPRFLHRFYSNTSSFIHGGVEKAGEEQQPVMGQGEIHKKIMSLNFNDCHAKIRQVDSQATVGTAVVIQVTGELSNNGGPMRRFMQTFVLAPQTANKYYVHNDIFRYQDEVFEETDESEEEEAEQQQHAASVISASLPEPANQLIENTQADVKLYNQNQTFNQTPVKPDSPSPMMNQEQPITTDNRPHINGQHELPTPAAIDETPAQRPLTPQQAADVEFVQQEASPPNEPVSVSQQPGADSEPLEKQAFSWATRLKGQPAGIPLAGQGQPVKVSPAMDPTPAQALSAPVIPAAASTAAVSPGEDFSTSQQRTVRQNNRDNRGGGMPRGDNRPPRPFGGQFGGGDEMDERQQHRHPDTHQVFVGNLPHEVAEMELKEFFSSYGNVINMRINRNAMVGKVPFGFVVFDDVAAVKAVLDEKRVEFKGHRLNVEEKKMKQNPNIRPSGPRGMRDNMGGRQQHRGGSRGPMGQPREGSGNRTDGRNLNRPSGGPGGPPAPRR